jgi:hypothetical protein
MGGGLGVVATGRSSAERAAGGSDGGKQGLS